MATFKLLLILKIKRLVIFKRMINSLACIRPVHVLTYLPAHAHTITIYTLG